MTAVLFLARLAIRLIHWLPDRLRRGLAFVLGRALYYLPWSKHRVIDRNLAMCFPEWSEAERRALHRAYLVDLFRLVFDAGALWHAAPPRLRREIRFDDGEELLAPSPPGSAGTLYVSGHFGNWELLNLRISMEGPTTTLYRAPTHPGLDRFINEPRARFGARMVPGDRAAIRELLTALRQGRSAAIAADIQPKRGEGLFVPFFGLETLTMTLVHKLARKTGCRVVLTTLRRHTKSPGWSATMIDVTDWMATDDVHQALSRINAWLEARIREAPEQYLWLYKRFSKRPDGEPPRYPKLKPRPSSTPPSSSD
jgi:KDO2-lipid IV(A) lauroyltransferase